MSRLDRIRLRLAHWLAPAEAPDPLVVDPATDVSDRVALEEALAAARRDAERAAAVKTEFLANMSHEIRTPLTSILGFASLLAEKELGEEADTYVSRVMAASRSLLAIVNDVLDFSRLESGGLELRPRATDPLACGAEVVELFTAEAAVRDVTVVFAPEMNADPVLVDGDRLRQVVMNLVSNAVKFTEAGSVQVTCRMVEGRLRYEVRDTGPGLDDAGRAKLFQRFSQVDASTTRAHGGAGLGLAICHGLVAAMGGRIGVESWPGVGSTFWFEVPVEGCARPAADATGIDLEALLGVRVLAVDDNPANRELVASILQPLGVEVTPADSGGAAVAAAQGAPFDVILMDLRMPGIDGWTAAREIRRAGGPNSETPILAFSADVTADRAAIADLFQGAVQKPVELAALVEAVAQWTDFSSPGCEGQDEPDRAYA